ncbi:MAG: homoserine kinase [Alistipes sp.]|nr:homoserine kinase [Alistipes sp.]
MKSVRVFAPATVANMGCGFDVMGMTLDGVGDVLCVTVDEGDDLQIENLTDIELPSDIDKNVVTPAIRAMMEAFGESRSVKVVFEKKIAPGSGIGSSAASSAAAVYALNEALGRPFSDERLVEFAMEGEKLISGGTPHADNVGPSILGGVVLLRGYHPLDIVRLPVPDNFCCSVAHPAIMVSTRMAREVLPTEIPLRMAVEQWGNVAGLVAGLALGDVHLVGRAMRDVVVEPHRKQFIPQFDELRRKVTEVGALAFNISGAGPSVFSLSADMETAEKVGEVMRQHFAELGVESDIYVSKVSNQGARVVE